MHYEKSFEIRIGYNKEKVGKHKIVYPIQFYDLNYIFVVKRVSPQIKFSKMYGNHHDYGTWIYSSIEEIWWLYWWLKGIGFENIKAQTPIVVNWYLKTYGQHLIFGIESGNINY